ncbi:hypothetical protein HBZS_102560 [Helicobacter bizzozeronii CCUG 35545]|nr:hypothetical protein HBZS_102560 [Helicobacter bizzozeronii CCUG 35545]
MGSAEGYVGLGDVYLDGGYGVLEDDQKSLEYYQKAAQMGSAEGYYKLGRTYEYGSYAVKQNIPKALEYYNKAGELGYAQAYDRLGFIYKMGDAGSAGDPRDVGVDEDKSAEYYRKAEALNKQQEDKSPAKCP